MIDRSLCIAKIATNEGDGEYTVTSQWWDADAGEYKAAGISDRAGLVGAAARDWMNRPGGLVGALVRVWRVPKIGGGVELVIDVPETGYVLAVVPANRADDCAWIQSPTNPYFFGWPCDSGGDVVTTPLALSGATAAQFSIIRTQVRNRQRGLELNVRGGDIVPCTYDGSDYRIGEGDWYDEPVGARRAYFEPDLHSATLPPGWYWMENTISYVMPNTDVDTLGDTRANTDIRQTLDVVQGTNAGGFVYPRAHNQGEVEEIILSAEVTAPIEVMGNYSRVAQRFN